MINKLKKIVGFAVFIALIISILGFVHFERRNRLVARIEITITGFHNNRLVLEHQVEELIHERGIDYRNSKVKDINLIAVTEAISVHPAVEKVNAYFQSNGVLSIEIEERDPVIRIIDGLGEQYYIDAKGKYMPLLEHVSARIPVANGFIFDPYYRLNIPVGTIQENDSLSSLAIIDDLFEIAINARKDTFILAQMEQLYVNDNRQIELIPKLGPGSIMLGSSENIESKFENLKLFYQEGLPNAGWDKYSAINLTFHQQIICTKK